MRRLFALALGVGCVLVLFLACFWAVLFAGEQFGYRDAAHFYYPLYERVEQEWNKGRLPLWDASENSGMPLLGNPTAAVLYPGKIIYRVLPYPVAARAYTITHTLLALMGMYLLMRGWNTSRQAALLSGMTYAFAAPILFQYCNIIFLVGAAWVPFGLHAADLWLRQGRRRGILLLSVVLVMQVLGGDPQVAYGTGLCAGGYAIGIASARSRLARTGSSQRRGRPRMILLGLVVVWFVGVLLCAWLLPMTRPPRANPPPVPFRWTSWTPKVVLLAWTLIVMIWLMLRRKTNRVLPTMFAGLIVSAVLAGMVASVQLLPVMEYTSRTVRAADDGPHDIFPFSLEPHRLVEFLWPEFYGSSRTTYSSWAAFLPPRHTMEIWVPSLYAGGFTVILALSAFGFRGGDHRRALLSGIALVGIAASLGEFGSPVWLARNIPGVPEILGPHDPIPGTAMRLDGKLRDGDGGVYSLMAILLPGFGSFRYPSKLLTFVCLGIAGLAGLGLDRLADGDRKRAARIGLILAIVSLIALIGVQLGRSWIFAAFKAHVDVNSSSSFGPFDVSGAWTETRNALAHGAILYASAFATIVLFGKHPARATALALIITTADLAYANSRLIITVPQSVFETRPEVLKKIDEAEKLDPSPGPFRVHRMPYWEPTGWNQSSSPQRYRELVEWERRTIQPKYAIPLGIHYTLTEGVAELYDYWWFFSPFLANRMRPSDPPDNEKNPQIVYHPRRGFDLWNTRYFLVPALYFNDERRSFSSFTTNSDPVYPTREQLLGEAGDAFFKDWSLKEDWRLLKNKQMFPRSWIVHIAEYREPITNLNRSNREPLMKEMLYADDPFWTQTGQTVQDLRRLAFVEVSDRREMFGFFSRAEPDPEETATIVELDDQRVEIRAKLKSNGLVILSDIDYPGWEMTIDGKPSPILRVNRLMRGAAVPAGDHTIVYRYRPRSVMIGAVISSVGLLLLAVLAVITFRRPLSLTLRASPSPDL